MSAYGKITNFSSPMDHREMMGVLDAMSERFSFLGITSIGESMLGRMIPIVTLGQGEKAVLYVGAHSAGEWRASLFLLRFLQEMCEWLRNDACAFRYSVKYLLATRTLYFVPMINPDGVEYRLHGVEKEHILHDRLIKMNGQSEDFSSWQANARGVDLRYNYPCGFFEHRAQTLRDGLEGGAPEGYGGEIPESEPEVGNFCNFLRFRDDIRAVVSLYLSGEKIVYRTQDRCPPRARDIAAKLSLMSGYALFGEERVRKGSLHDFVTEEWNCPSFEIYCGNGKKSHAGSDGFYDYMTLREMLFMLPTLI